jgi:uncharacterized protein YdcH (DUF465 family)
MSIPDKVAAQLKKAQELQKNIAPKGNTDKDPLTPDDKNTSPELKPGDALKPDENKSQPAPLEPTAEPLSPEPTAEPIKPVETPAPADDENSQTWKQKHNVIKGKYEAEVPRLNTQVTHLTGQVNFLSNENLGVKQQLETANRQNVELQVAKPAESDTVKPGKLDPEAFRTFGDEFVGLAETLNNLSGSVGDLEGSVGSVQSVQADGQKKERVKYRDKLTARIKGFDAINDSPGFIGYLQANPVINSQLQSYNDQMNHIEVAKIFKGYTDQAGDTIIPPVEDPKPTPNPAPDPKLSLEKVSITPDGSASQSSVPDTQKQTYTKAQISKFYNDQREGKFKGKEDQAWVKKTQADILAATRDGRIIDNY